MYAQRHTWKYELLLTLLELSSSITLIFSTTLQIRPIELLKFYHSAFDMSNFLKSDSTTLVCSLKNKQKNLFKHKEKRSAYPNTKIILLGFHGTWLLREFVFGLNKTTLIILVEKLCLYLNRIVQEPLCV